MPLTGSIIIATLALAAALFWAPVSAAAHGDDGSMDVQSSAQTGPNTLRLEVSIPYPDGDLADNATVTATLNGPKGAVIPNVPVPRTATGYAADLTVAGSGTWRVAVRSRNPIAEATVEVDIVGSTSTGQTSPPSIASGRVKVALLVAAAVPLIGLGFRHRRRSQTGG